MEIAAEGAPGVGIKPLSQLCHVSYAIRNFDFHLLNGKKYIVKWKHLDTSPTPFP